jgi:hypothetical protein
MGTFSLDGGADVPIGGEDKLTFVPPVDPEVSRSLSTDRYTGSSSPVGVTLAIALDRGTGPFDFSISEDLPANWTATDISDGGSFMDGTVSWTLMAVGESTSLTYTLVPADTTRADVTLLGTFSFDGGEDRPIAGADLLTWG